MGFLQRYKNKKAEKASRRGILRSFDKTSDDWKYTAILLTQGQDSANSFRDAGFKVAATNPVTLSNPKPTQPSFLDTFKGMSSSDLMKLDTKVKGMFQADVDTQKQAKERKGLQGKETSGKKVAKSSLKGRSTAAFAGRGGQGQAGKQGLEIPIISGGSF
jgi:hypothetical protein